MNRTSRLQSAKSSQWVSNYTGKNIIRGYRKWYGVDALAAAIELRQLGVPISAAREEELRQTAACRSTARKKTDVPDDPDSDGTFAYIAGYTPAGFPYGVTWDEMEEAPPWMDEEVDEPESERVGLELTRETHRSAHGNGETPMLEKHSTEDYTSPLPGIQQKTLVFGERTLMTEFLLAKDSDLPIHAHPYEQTGYLVKGHLILKIGEAEHDVTPGDSWCIPMNVPHGARILEDAVAIEIFSPARADYLPCGQKAERHEGLLP